jgi:succinate-acetate transporter protein
MITHNSLIAFILLIFTLFNFSLLISTLQARKASQILEVVETQNIIIAMLLD